MPKKKKVKKKTGTTKAKKKAVKKTVEKLPIPDIQVEPAGVYNLPIPGKLKKKERPDWARNHELILYHALAYVDKHLRFPSGNTLSKQNGLSIITGSLGFLIQRKLLKKNEVSLSHCSANLFCNAADCSALAVRSIRARKLFLIVLR